MDKIETTKEELAEAYRLWNNDYLNDKEGFLKEVTSEEDFPTKQVKTLIYYLEMAKNK